MTFVSWYKCYTDSITAAAAQKRGGGGAYLHADEETERESQDEQNPWERQQNVTAESAGARVASFCSKHRQ